MQCLVVWSLFLFCIFQKSINVFFKCIFVGFRSINNDFFPVDNGGRYIRRVMVISLTVFIYFSSSVTVKAEPSIIKGFSFPSGQVVSKLPFGFFEVINPQTKIMVNIVWPIHGGLINFFEFFVESSSKFLSGNVKNVSTTNLGCVSQPDENDYKGATSTKQEKIDGGEGDIENIHFLWYFLPPFLVALFFDIIHTQRLGSSMHTMNHA